MKIEQKAKRRVKELLTGAFACAVLGGIGYGIQSNVYAYNERSAEADAMIARDINNPLMSEYAFRRNANYWENYANEHKNKKGYYSDEYNPYGNEEPLSKMYPHGANASDVDTETPAQKRADKKADEALNREIKQDDAEDKAEERTEARHDRHVNKWYASHSHVGRSKIYYVRYNGFSKKQWRYAFPDWGSTNVDNRLGLSKSYSAVINAFKSDNTHHPKAYKSDVVVKPGQLVKAKFIKNYIYRILYRGHKYYYADDDDQFESEITPFTADYSHKEHEYNSTLHPWQSKIIILKNSDRRIHQGSEWIYNYHDDESDYKLKGRVWRNTGLGTDSPDWLD